MTVNLNFLKNYCVGHNPITTCCNVNALTIIFTIIFVYIAYEPHYTGDRLSVKRYQYIPRVITTKNVANATSTAISNRAGNNNAEVPQGLNVPNENDVDQLRMLPNDPAHPQDNVEQSENSQVHHDADLHEPETGVAAPRFNAFPLTDDTITTTEHVETTEYAITKEKATKYGWLAGNFFFCLYVLRRVAPWGFMIACVIGSYMKLVKSLIRSIIASPKQLHYDSNLNLYLDLAYITPQLIVSSAPTTTYLESWYRYPLDDLLNYLETNHNSHWHLFNFRGEDPGYKDEEVQFKVSHYPFPDHYPPPIRYMIDATDEIDRFLSQTDENVAVLHCKAGKGRSGTLGCAYLMLSGVKHGHSMDVDSVIGAYTERRMRRFGGDGVSIVSQKRYLRYWGQYLQSDELKQQYSQWSNNHEKLLIDKIIFRNCIKKELPLSISQYKAVQESNRENTVVETLIPHVSSDVANFKREGKDLVCQFRDPVYVDEDIMIGIGGFSYLWFNTFFEHISTIKTSCSFPWEGIDGFKGTKQQGFRFFDRVEFYFSVY
ncbi:TEP1 [Candida margitis]|uniref:TEP1 n=1 Tax=Candida margitis TaxID=1775924 RepID=UPI0022267DA1|nr:TEP1 [Candida margitis]KAI5970177.1 TEP1 [Candida margitis]